LSTRSDTLIMTSATPHDGRAGSFASLMNMLNPTAIADPAHDGPDDIKGLFLRRFKKDVQAQVAGSFSESRGRARPRTRDLRARVAVGHDAPVRDESAYRKASSSSCNSMRDLKLAPSAERNAMGTRERSIIRCGADHGQNKPLWEGLPVSRATQPSL
jgi:hypothetical protein